MKKLFSFLIMLTMLSLPCAHADELYSCIDRDGNSIITSSPQDGMKNCVLKDSYEDPAPYERAEKKYIKEQKSMTEKYSEERNAREQEQKEISEKYTCKSNCYSDQKTCNDACEQYDNPRYYDWLNQWKSCRKTCSESYDRCLYNKCNK
jgi:hypothetical protein